MSDIPMRRSAYDGLLNIDPSRQAPGTPGVYLQDQGGKGIIVVRGQSADERFLKRAEEALGLGLPLTPSTCVSHEQVTALWISPDEWWILCPISQTTAYLNKLETKLTGLFVQVIDSSAGLSVVRLTGGEHLTMLRHLCPYPVETIRVGQCISTVFPKANVTLVRLERSSTLLISRRSYAHWISELLLRSARPYGLARLPQDGQL